MCKFWLIYTKVLPRHLLLRLLTCWQSPWQAQGTLEKFAFLEKQTKMVELLMSPFIYLCISLTELVKWWKIYSVFKTELNTSFTCQILSNGIPKIHTFTLWTPCYNGHPDNTAQEKIYCIRLTQVNSCHYRLSLFKTLTRGPWTVHHKESWLY